MEIKDTVQFLGTVECERFNARLQVVLFLVYSHLTLYCYDLFAPLFQISLSSVTAIQRKCDKTSTKISDLEFHFQLKVNHEFH